MSENMYFVLVLGAAIAVMVLFRALVFRYRPLYGLILPELALFASYRDRTRAFGRASTSFHGTAWFALLFVGMQMGLLMFLRRSPWLGSASFMRFTTVFLAALLALYFVGSVVFCCLFRERLRRSLRQQLVEGGRAICVQCGYDLRAQAEPRCPECGSAGEPGGTKGMNPNTALRQAR